MSPWICLGGFARIKCAEQNITQPPTYSLTQRQHDLEKSEFLEGRPSSSLHAILQFDGHNQP
jgi:hypothetical protein